MSDLIPVIMKVCLAGTAFLMARDFIRSPSLDSIAFPGATVLFLWFGIWEMGR
jgi:hypothetical protein